MGNKHYAAKQASTFNALTSVIIHISRCCTHTSNTIHGHACPPFYLIYCEHAHHNVTVPNGLTYIYRILESSFGPQILKLGKFVTLAAVLSWDEHEFNTSLQFLSSSKGWRVESFGNFPKNQTIVQPLTTMMRRVPILPCSIAVSVTSDNLPSSS